MSKNGTPLKVILVPEVIEILWACREDNGTQWVFPAKSTAGHLSDPKKAWARMLDTDELAQLTLRLEDAGHSPPDQAGGGTLSQKLLGARELCEKHGIETGGTRLLDFRPHDLRRTLGSYQAITGASLPIIGKSLGHKSQAATQIYAHLDLDPVRDSVTKATHVILEMGGVIQPTNPDEAT